MLVSGPSPDQLNQVCPVPHLYFCSRYPGDSASWQEDRLGTFLAIWNGVMPWLCSDAHLTGLAASAKADS